MASTPPSGPSPGAIRVLIADDHRSFGEALRTVIDLERGLVVESVVTDGRTAIEVVTDQAPDVVLMDLEMPKMDGLEAIRRIRKLRPSTRVVVLSAHDDEEVLARAVEAGADAFISKSRPVADVADAVRRTAAGEVLVESEAVREALGRVRLRREQEASERARAERLTPREVEILQLMADGLEPSQIAERVGISAHTLRTHTQNILTRLGVHSKLQALAVAIRHGTVTPGKPDEGTVL